MKIEFKATYKGKELVIVIPELQPEQVPSLLQTIHRKLDELTNKTKL